MGKCYESIVESKVRAIVCCPQSIFVAKSGKKSSIQFHHQLFRQSRAHLGNVNDLYPQCVAPGGASTLLSGLSHCAGVVMSPKMNARLKHIEFVNLVPGRFPARRRSPSSFACRESVADLSSSLGVFHRVEDRRTHIQVCCLLDFTVKAVRVASRRGTSSQTINHLKALSIELLDRVHQF